MKNNNKKITSSISNRKESGPRFFNKVKRFAGRLMINKLMLAIVSGVIVGTIFGLTALHMLNNDEGQHAFHEAHSNHSQVSTTSSDGMNEIDLDMPNIYVIQIGLFHERENAEVSKGQLERRNIKSFIWERKDEYFLLHSAYRSEAKAKAKHEQLQEDQLETFVKTWDMLSIEIQVTQDEQAWLQEYVSLWDESFEQFEAKESIAVADWEALLEKDYESEIITEIQRKVIDIVPNLQTSDQAESTLLSMLMQFERMTTR